LSAKLEPSSTAEFIGRVANKNRQIFVDKIGRFYRLSVIGFRSKLWTTVCAFAYLADAARQPLFSVILSNPVYISIYVRPRIFAAAKRQATIWRLA